MVNSIDKVPFALASWELNLRHDDSFRKWWNITALKGMSIAGMSDREHATIIEYCNSNGAEYISKKRKFEDFLYTGYSEKVMNLPPDLIDYTYDENELVVIGTHQMIDDALVWTKQLPPRSHICYTQDIPLRDIKRCVVDTNWRILPNTSDPGGYFVSTDNNQSLFPLWLQG
jgi:hypothetical protein